MCNLLEREGKRAFLHFSMQEVFSLFLEPSREAGGGGPNTPFQHSGAVLDLAPPTTLTLTPYHQPHYGKASQGSLSSCQAVLPRANPSTRTPSKSKAGGGGPWAANAGQVHLPGLQEVVQPAGGGDEHVAALPQVLHLGEGHSAVRDQAPGGRQRWGACLGRQSGQ